MSNTTSIDLAVELEDLAATGGTDVPLFEAAADHLRTLDAVTNELFAETLYKNQAFLLDQLRAATMSYANAADMAKNAASRVHDIEKALLNLYPNIVANPPKATQEGENEQASA